MSCEDKLLSPVCRLLKDQWKFDKSANLLPLVHHGRALLQYEGDAAKRADDKEKPLVFQPHLKHPLPSVEVNKLNMTQDNLVDSYSSEMAERKDLMVIKSKWNFLGEGNFLI